MIQEGVNPDQYQVLDQNRKLYELLNPSNHLKLEAINAEVDASWHIGNFHFTCALDFNGIPDKLQYKFQPLV